MAAARLRLSFVHASEVQLRFTLRTFLIGVAVIAILLGVTELATRDYRERRSIERDLHSMGANYVGFNEHGHLTWVSFAIPVASPRIAEYRSFEHVDLAGARVTDESIQHLAGLDHIGAIHLTDSDVTDEQIVILSQIESLQILRLGGTEVTDEAIEAIASIERLQAVDLSGTLVSDDGVERLKKLRPHVNVRR